MAGRQVRFAQFRFDARTRELFRWGRRVRLGEKPSRVLEALLARPGDLVARAELRRLLWDEHTFVDFDNNLNSAVASLREALGDSAQAPMFIETLPRLGYRFIGTIDADAGAPPPQAEPAGTAAAAPTAGAPARVDVEMCRPHAPRRLAAAALVAMSTVAAASGVNTARTVTGPDPAAVHDARYLLTRAAPGDAAHALEVLAPFAARDRVHPAASEAIADAWLAEARTGRTDAFAHAEDAARRALAADPSRAGAWRVLSSVRLLRDRDHAAAARFAARAVRMAPRDPAAHLTSAAADAVRGRYDAAIAAAAEAIRLDPGRWRLRADLAFFLLAARRYDAALEASRAALALEPGSTAARDLQLIAAERLGYWDEARDAALALMSAAGANPSDRDAVRRAPARDAVVLYRRWQISVADRLAARAGWPPMTAAAIYAAAGEAADAVEWLRRAEAARDPMLVFLPAFRDFDPIRDDPGFQAFTASVG